MTDKPLTPKQRAFVAAYVGAAKGNATQAARMAGYSGNDKTLQAIGSENLAKPMVRQALEVFRLATATTAIMDAQEAAERLSRIARGGGEGENALTEKRVVSGGPAGFIEADVPPGFSHQLDAIRTLAKMRGWDVPPPSSADVTAAPALSPDMERALIRLAQLSPEQWAAFQAGVSTGG